MKLYVNSDSLNDIATFLNTVSGESTATFDNATIMAKDYSDSMIEEIIGFEGEWSSATTARKKEIVAILNAYYDTSSGVLTPEEVDEIVQEQIIHARDNYSLGGIV